MAYMEKIVVATGNMGKLRELRDMLDFLPARLLSLGEAGFYGDIPETGDTFEQNALCKARGAAQATGLPAIADDSGLEVDALGGAPGIYSARYAGPGAGDAERTAKLLRELEGVPDEKRTARFVSALAFVQPDGRHLVVRGECEGIILRAPRGDGGFGYDPVFWYPPLKKSFGELSDDEKNGVSHRHNAMELFSVRLKEMLYADR